MSRYSERRFNEMIFKLETMFKEMADRLVEKLDPDQSWEQWYDVEKLEKFYWTDAVIDGNLSGRNCKRLRGINVDSELFGLASHAIAY